jgi:hypothetical protein
MNKATAIALLIAGAVVLVFGINSYHSMASGVSRVFTGAPTDKAIWLIAGGALASVAGLFGLARS